MTMLKCSGFTFKLNALLSVETTQATVITMVCVCV